MFWNKIYGAQFDGNETFLEEFVLSTMASHQFRVTMKSFKTKTKLTFKIQLKKDYLTD